MMTKLSQRLLLLVALFVGITTSACARPAEQTPTEPPVQGDTIEIMSTSMQRNIKNVVIVPAKYFDKDLQDQRYPVLYLLHGAYGCYSDWSKKTDLHRLADQYDIIIVCPDGQDSWYFDSPIDPNFQFETYVVHELRNYVETHYRTINHPKYRAITGLSMGGHGALWLAWRHPDVYGSCGSMEGGVDIYNFPNRWKVNERLGEFESNKEVWREHSVMSLVPTLEPGQNIVIDAGKNDIFIEANNALHEALDKQGIPHDYTVRPGRHSWSFWVNALDYQMLFFYKAFNSGVKY